MTLTRIIGDVHGKWKSYREIVDNCAHLSVQVGDFGVGFAGVNAEEEMNQFHSTGQHRFIRGNHDHPAVCKTAMTGYIADGTVEGDVMYVGGAWSIDREWRVEGQDWWRDEELSYSELDQLIATYESVRPRVMITHDCPTLAAYRMFVRDGKGIAGRAVYLSRTGEALQAMFEIHQPEHWYFGHWHHTVSMTIDGTVFQCLGELDYVDVEL